MALGLAVRKGEKSESEAIVQIIDSLDVLGIENASQALAGFDEDEKGICNVYGVFGKQAVLTVYEPGLYRLRSLDMLKKLTFDELGGLDAGAAGKIADAEIQKAICDLIDRGRDDGKSRKAVFELEIYYQLGKIVAHLAAQAKLPPRRTGGTSCAEKEKQGELFLAFRDDNPDNADQPTFDDVGTP